VDRSTRQTLPPSTRFWTLNVWSDAVLRLKLAATSFLRFLRVLLLLSLGVCLWGLWGLVRLLGSEGLQNSSTAGEGFSATDAEFPAVLAS
jgi:hypothetical protein